MRGRTVGEAGRREEAATITVRVLPRASREEVGGLSGSVVRIRLAAPPLENRANEALVRFLSDSLGVPRSRVEIVSGRRGRTKVVRVGGISRNDLFVRLGLRCPPD